MKAYLLLSLGLLALLLVNAGHSISGAGASYVNITNTIIQTSSSLAVSNVVYTFIYNGSGTVNLTLQDNAYNIKLLLAGSPYTFSQTSGAQCPAPLNSLGGCTNIEIPGVTSSDVFFLSYSYQTNYAPTANIFNSSFAFISFSTSSSLRIITVLPSGAFLPPTRYSEPSGAVFSTNGQNIDVSWSFQLTAELLGSPSPVEVSYEDNFPATAPASSYNSYLIAGIVVVGIIIILLTLRKYKEKPEVVKNKKRPNPFTILLNADEKKVLSLLRRDKFTAQKDLIAATNFSKAKMSKIIAKLSRYKLVKLQFEGKSNKIKRV